MVVYFQWVLNREIGATHAIGANEEEGPGYPFPGVCLPYAAAPQDCRGQNPAPPDLRVGHPPPPPASIPHFPPTAPTAARRAKWGAPVDPSWGSHWAPDPRTP